MNKFKKKKMKLRTVRKSDGKYAIQKEVRGSWEEIAIGFSTLADAEDHIVNVLGMDIKEEVIAVYEYNVKTMNP